MRHVPNLHGCEVPAEKIATIVDEVPVLALVAAHARGVTVFREVGELRVKETDRLAAVVEGLDASGRGRVGSTATTCSWKASPACACPSGTACSTRSATTVWP